MSASTITKRLHISFTPSVPANGPEELAKSLTAHLGKFGTVKSVDGLGQLDGVGLPRKFGFVSIEGSEAGITKCVNSLSGSIWKGVKVRVGDARPNFDERIAQENAEETAPPRRKRKRGGVYAEDMTPVTSDIAAQRSGWKVTEMGRVIRPLRIRPARPLPPPLVSLPKKVSASTDKDSAKPKKRRDPDSRSRRRTIDMMRWGSVHLKGIFLEDAGQRTGHVSQDEVEEMVAANQSDSSSGDESVPPPGAKSTAIPVILPAVAEPLPARIPPILVSKSTTPQLLADPPVQSDIDVDLLREKNQSLSLLNSLFGAQDGEWGGRESVGSDVDEDELLKIGDGEDAIEFVPMDVDAREPSPVAERPSPSPKTAEPKKPTQATRLKDLFVSRNEDAGFSLLGHLDLDLELDDEFTHVDTEKQQEDLSEAAPATFVTQSSHTHITLDPKQPLFFPLPTSFSSTPGFLSSTKARQRDILDVGKDNGWPAHFCRNETDEEIRKKWEEEKVELTREWNRRWREAWQGQEAEGWGRWGLIRV
ncbi:hypothetical protein B0H16DRAFT_1664234 [Mycena metata]|uniref:RRM domain-containing protein n=1 Tax=Mycena metata TaxID=1033252 RepID=A0AAD7IHZ8_9AGAR|nr:hypothetical protein B0H16DRAFT_1664234 [Mycena metata]